MSHTPGPWRVHTNEQDEWKTFIVAPADGTATICEVVREDDARIIARAPMLLMSLKRLVADINEEMWSVLKCWCYQLTTPERPCNICNLAAAKALIAEIEGAA